MHDFDDAVGKQGVRLDAFVAQVKAIVEDNCQGTPAGSLRINCGRLLNRPMMERDQYMLNTSKIRYFCQVAV